MTCYSVDSHFFYRRRVCVSIRRSHSVSFIQPSDTRFPIMINVRAQRIIGMGFVV